MKPAPAEKLIEWAGLGATHREARHGLPLFFVCMLFIKANFFVVGKSKILQLWLAAALGLAATCGLWLISEGKVAIGFAIFAPPLLVAVALGLMRNRLKAWSASIKWDDWVKRHPNNVALTKLRRALDQTASGKIKPFQQLIAPNDDGVMRPSFPNDTFQLPLGAAYLLKLPLIDRLPVTNMMRLEGELVFQFNHSIAPKALREQKWFEVIGDLPAFPAKWSDINALGDEKKVRAIFDMLRHFRDAAIQEKVKAGKSRSGAWFDCELLEALTFAIVFDLSFPKDAPMVQMKRYLKEHHRDAAKASETQIDQCLGRKKYPTLENKLRDAKYALSR